MTKNKLLLLLALLMTAATGAMAADTYTVAGSNSAMFGFAWDPTYTANDMTKNGDGTYSITYTNVNFTEPEEVQYKVVKNHSWDEAYPALDRVINIAEAGTYTLTIHFNPTTHEVYETMPANKFDITLKAANANTIEAGKATVTVGGAAATVTEGKLQGVKMGSEVKMTAKEGYKFRKVEVKKAETLPALNITNPSVGQVIGSDGKNYAYGSLPTDVTAVAKVCYVDGNGHGLALALTDEGQMNWSTAIETCAAHTPAFTGGTWKLASKAEWSYMISAAGSYGALRNGFSSVGGTNMQSGVYFSSTEYDSYYAWLYYFNNGFWDFDSKNYSLYVRPCLAF